MSPTPEQRARQDIDAALEAAGWIVQDRATMNLSAAPGVAVREFRMASGHGFADYLLFVNGKAVGALEAKPSGYRLINVELQADKYATGLPAGLNPPAESAPLPLPQHRRRDALHQRARPRTEDARHLREPAADPSPRDSRRVDRG